ncbi:MAG: sulfite exporter TauE/SafE family protein [Bacteroidales bacterium]|nr:sulfite exporter TauE/SafE family protein [Bacteroidales bacterium]
MLIFLTGFFAGSTHVLTGPDHLAAVTPFSINFRKRAWIIGCSWGLGHTIGALLLGVLFILFKEYFPVEIISANSERIVGIMLILIGGWAIARIYIKSPFKKHAHPHVHANSEVVIHVHQHDHSVRHAHDHEHEIKVKQTVWTTLGIGILHGLAGFSHLLAVLPTLVLPGTLEPVIYLSAFGAGTILTMIAFTCTMGIIAHKLEASRRYKLLTWISFAGGVAAIVIGVIWLVIPV